MSNKLKAKYNGEWILVSSGSGSGRQVQSNWDQTNPSALDFIRNKPDENDALSLVMEMGLLNLAMVDNVIYTDENGVILSL